MTILDSLSDSFVGGFLRDQASPITPPTAPSVSTYSYSEDSKSFYLEFGPLACKKEDLSVLVRDGILSVGVKAERDLHRNYSHGQQPITKAMFSRKIGRDARVEEAKLENGVLTIRVILPETDWNTSKIEVT